MTTNELLGINDLRVVTCDNNRLLRVFDLALGMDTPAYTRERTPTATHPSFRRQL